MSTSLKINITKKFLLAYLVAISLATLSFAVGFYYYYNYITQTIAKSVHNALFIGDFHSLKETIAPLIDQSIQAIKIVDAQKQTVFFHQDASAPLLQWVMSQSLHSNSYQMQIVFNVIKPAILLCAIYLLALTVIYPISYLEKQKQDKKRKDFLLSLSQKYAHDIRSPLSSLNIISYKIEDPQVKEMQQMISEAILQSSNSFLSRIKNYAENPEAPLDIVNSNIPTDHQNNRTELKNSDFSVEKLVSLLKTEFSNRGVSQNITFINEVLPEVLINRTDIILPIIRNLIQNSIEATDSQFGEISINFKRLNNKICIAVADNGKGISPQIIDRLGKEKISYGKNTHSFSGNGVGLFNAYNDLKSIQAELVIRSKLGQGTEVVIYANI